VVPTAGVLASRVRTAAEAAWISALRGRAYDLTWLVKPGSVRSALLTGMLVVQPVPTVAEVLVWIAYAIPLSLYGPWPRRTRSHPRAAAVVAS